MELTGQRLGGVVAAVTIALLSGCNGAEAPPASRSRGGATVVETIVIRPQPIENTIFTTGTLLANEEVVLRPEISGRVVQVSFEEGQKVQGGALLVKINDNELQAELKRKALEEDLLTKEERRAQALFDVKGISEEEFDKVRNRRSMVSAEREVIESQLAETEIRAPFDGTVGLRYISEGTFVSSGTTIATIQDTDPIKVEFAVPEKYADLIGSGTPVLVRVGESQQPYRGKVYAAEAKVDPATRTLKARATIPNPEGLLIPGGFAKVEITLERIADAVVIPSSAVIPELAGEKVFVVRNGLAESVPVTTGIRTDRAVQIVEGLNVNDTLVTTGLLQLSDGKPVQVKTASTLGNEGGA